MKKGNLFYDSVKKNANKKQNCGYIYKEEHNIEGSTIIISGSLSAKAVHRFSS